MLFILYDIFTRITVEFGFLTRVDPVTRHNSL